MLGNKSPRYILFCIKEHVSSAPSLAGHIPQLARRYTPNIRFLPIRSYNSTCHYNMGSFTYCVSQKLNSGGGFKLLKLVLIYSNPMPKTAYGGKLY